MNTLFIKYAGKESFTEIGEIKITKENIRNLKNLSLDTHGVECVEIKDKDGHIVFHWKN